MKALEDNLCALSLAGGAELGEEVEEEPEEPDFSTIPLAFNQPRHLQVQATISTSTGNFAGMYRQPVLWIRIRIGADRHHFGGFGSVSISTKFKTTTVTTNNFFQKFSIYVLSKILNLDSIGSAESDPDGESRSGSGTKSTGTCNHFHSISTGPGIYRYKKPFP